MIISDSMTRPYISVVLNFALASSNIPSLIILILKPEIYGYSLKNTELSISDELPAVARILMGQGNDGQPLPIIKGFTRDK